MCDSRQRREAKELKKKGILPPYAYKGDASKFRGSASWTCDLVTDDVMDAVQSAWNQKRTPLLIDDTATDRDDPKPTPLDEYFGGAYRGMDAQVHAHTHTHTDTEAGKGRLLRGKLLAFWSSMMR